MKRHSVLVASIPYLITATDFLHDYSDLTWSAIWPTVWLQISLSLSILTACIPSLRVIIDSWLGHVGSAAMNNTYELQPGSTWKSGGRTTITTDVDGSRFSRQIRSGKRISTYDTGKVMGAYEEIHANSSSRVAKQPSESGESVQRLTAATGSRYIDI